ncbi:hypothetical protein J437_LFUL008833 [Ladona fulva]|uniref:Uncharacterized protein n=1 Tax=Ladona fulva TaxID=123851 RepID=A0A8K0KEU2_LADFU|nr:hypothetical protein J437_LFUL008833 [Ladona fulva]
MIFHFFPDSTMGSLWRRIAILIFVVFGVLDASYGYPIGDVEGNYGLNGNWLTLWPCLLSAALLFVATAAIGCCLCCRNNQNGFKVSSCLHLLTLL